MSWSFAKILNNVVGVWGLSSISELCACVCVCVCTLCMDVLGATIQECTNTRILFPKILIKDSHKLTGWETNVAMPNKK